MEILVIDCIIRNGLVVDGSGAPGVVADVGIDDHRIVEIGDFAGVAAQRTIDADGLVVSPGFVDIHTHYDAQALWDGTLSPSPLHGVTTVIGGNCGFSLAPINPAATEYIGGMLSAVEGIPLAALKTGVGWKWDSFGSYLDGLDGRLAVNAGFLVGHSTLRALVMGGAAVERHATQPELAAMEQALRQSLQEGGLGFSSTWSASHNDHNGAPVPSRAGALDELLRLAAVTGEFDGTSVEFIPSAELHFSEDDREILAALATASGRIVNWNLLAVYGAPTDDTSVASKLAASDVARQAGGTVVALHRPTANSFYVNFFTGTIYNSFPGWRDVLRLPPGELLSALADPEVRTMLKRGAEASDRPWSNFRDTTIEEVTAPQLRPLVGRTLGDIAAERSCDPADVLFDVLIEDELRTLVRTPLAGDDDQAWARRAALWDDPRVVIGGSDAGAHVDQVTGFSFYSEFFAQGVRDRRLVSLERAVRLVTDVPSRLYGLVDRGRLAPGAWADIVVFDLEKIGSRPTRTVADYPGDSQRLYADAEGIAHVIANGVEIVNHGAFTDSRPGRILRRGRDEITQGRLVTTAR
jgi:N-acyl-D-aspartate/D-glutamate deacylase